MKIYKNIRGLLIASALVSSTFGCDDILDTEPASQVGEAQFWNSESDAELGVAAIYDAMQSAYSSKYFLWGEMRSDNFDPGASATATALQLLENTLNSQNSSISNWSGLYRMILRANLAVNNLEQLDGNVDEYLGQAYALRAFAYFDAARVWGGAPLYLDAIKGLEDDIFRPKTQASQLFSEVIIPDMLRAEELIISPTNRFQFSKASVYCLQAEVYMHLGEYALAKEAMDKMIALNEYSLVTTATEFHGLFWHEDEPANVGSEHEYIEESGPELIFSIKYDLESADENTSGIYGLFFSGVPSYYISRKLEEKWQEVFPQDSAEWHAKYPNYTPSTVDNEGRTVYGDYHRYVQLYEGSVWGNTKDVGGRRYAKYNTTNYPGSRSDVDIVVYRYAGMLLLKAEAEMQLGNLQEAVDLVNRVRSARDLPQISLADFQTKDELHNTILDERQFELLGEGKRWWDLIRTNKAVEVMGPINGQTAGKLLFPIYFEHLVDNPNLTQTPGY